MTSKHILVAGDEGNMRRTLSLILRQAGYRASKAKDGYEALKIITDSKNVTESVDLLVTDIQISGLTVMELIVELDRLNIPLPVLVTTGHGHGGVGLKRKDCVEFIEKPFSAEDLLGQVSRLFEEK